MYSIAFPKMFRPTQTILIKDHEAIRTNLKLLLSTEKTSLFGDPFYGTELRTIIFEQNNQIVKDLVIDDIYTSILMFLPQVIVERKDITLTSDGVDIFATIKCTYYLDNVSDLYQINLTATDQQNK